MAPGSEKTRLSPSAMPFKDVSRLLSKVGGEPVTEEMLQADIDAGAPLNADGTMNVVHYAACGRWPWRTDHRMAN